MTATYLYFDETHDCRLRDSVTSLLNSSRRFRLRNLNVEARNGTVTLSGQVGSFHERQVAVNYAQHVNGVLQLVDKIQVDTLP